MKTQAKATAKPIINAISAQAGALTGAVTVTVQTRKTSASAKKLKSLEPLVSAMNAIGESASAELLSRLPSDTVAYKCFASHTLGTAQLFAWFAANSASLTRTTKEGKTLLDIASAYCAAFNVVHDRATDGPLKNMPFYKKLSNALQQWARLNGGYSKRASGAISDAIGAYLNKKLAEDSKELSDSLTAWVLKNESVRERIKKALETPAA